MVLIVVIAIQVIISIRERHYSLRDLALSQAIFNSLAFVYSRAIWYAVSGKQVPFFLTPKVASQSTGRSRVRITPVLIVIAAVLVSMLGTAGLSVVDAGMAIPLFWAAIRWSSSHRSWWSGGGCEESAWEAVWADPAAVVKWDPNSHKNPLEI